MIDRRSGTDRNDLDLPQPDALDDMQADRRIVLEIERRLATSPSNAQLSVIADLLGQLSSGTLNR
ncbi:MAG: hypothetical protein AUH85_01995 [Chloroflexi bacterium 13_1_40CM_4_68_4]|nr:MAG: hypothetical protein AUH85_01995 [Chloroflexi bacterium 13_1_40CM_4_68_4]